MPLACVGLFILDLPSSLAFCGRSCLLQQVRIPLTLSRLSRLLSMRLCSATRVSSYVRYRSQWRAIERDTVRAAAAAVISCSTSVRPETYTTSKPLLLGRSLLNNRCLLFRRNQLRCSPLCESLCERPTMHAWRPRNACVFR